MNGYSDSDKPPQNIASNPPTAADRTPSSPVEISGRRSSTAQELHAAAKIRGACLVWKAVRALKHRKHAKQEDGDLHPCVRLNTLLSPGCPIHGADLDGKKVEANSKVNFNLSVYITRHGISLANVLDAVVKDAPPHSGFKKPSHALLDPPLAEQAQEATKKHHIELPKNVSKVAVVSSVLMRAKQTAFLQFMEPWSKLDLGDRLHPQILVAPFIKENGKTLNNLPHNCSLYESHPAIPPSAINCVHESQFDPSETAPSEMFDSQTLVGFDSIGVFESNPTLFFKDVLFPQILPRLFPDGNVDVEEDGNVVIALATHGHVMNMPYIREPCIAAGAWPVTGKARQNQVVSFRFNVTYDGVFNGTLLTGCEKLDAGSDDIVSSIRAMDVESFKSFVGAHGLKMMKASLEMLFDADVLANEAVSNPRLTAILAA